GHALSIGIAAAGASVVVASRSLEACEATVTEIEKAGGAAVALSADISKPEGRERIVSTAGDTYGRPDILVHNAGILKPHNTLRVSEAELDELVAVNIKGPVFLSQVAFPHLEADGGGAIVNISALGAFQPMEGLGAYCAVKAAMVNWTLTMAK